ncbi:tyrosine-protein phosphatase [Novosphingobium lentum]|uniref:tyrosine-protein phosphatase n=1 Tax=Novosphingobium lentum TaxID=145287 RepID=UPI00083422E2|nr:tyrosine-protein phosphatase [Novosphingobium lentum]
MNRTVVKFLWAAALLAISPAALAQDATVERTSADMVEVRWTGAQAVDLYRAGLDDEAPAKAALVSANDRDGHETVAVPAGTRATFVLRNRADGHLVHAVERVIPLAQGSNFRDIGGYPAADGKHVAWGRIYRSGASPLLSDGDLTLIGTLGLHHLVDLRSDEERAIAPTRIDGVPYAAVGYRMASLMGTGPMHNGGDIYRAFPKLLAPQMRLVFDLLKRNDGAIEYNCSAGQDRTGFTTAMILSVLGTPRDVILKDYHLSTALRRPEFEMPKIDPAAFPGNMAAQMFARYQQNPAAAKPQPLMDANGRAFLLDAFAEIDQHWGSVEGYLQAEAGVTPADIARLRAIYTR